MTKISVPTLRFSEFDDEWKENKLNEVADRVTRKNKNLDSDLPLTISAQYGLIDQETFFNKKVASKDLSNYFLVKRGEFAYNKSYSNGYPFGTIKSLKKYDKGVLSSLYIVFSIKENISHLFMDSFFDSNHWHKEVSTKTTEGARNHGLLNISPQDFMKSKIFVPDNIEEQNRVGLFISNLDKLIELQSQKLEQLKKLKRGYLQKMFPQDGKSFPRLRFSGFSGEWKEEKLKEILKVGKSGGTPSTKNKEYYDGTIPFLSIKDVTESNGIINDTEKHINDDAIQNSSSWIVPKGSLTISMYASVGSVAKLSSDIATSQAFFNMIFDDGIDVDFMYHFFNQYNLMGRWKRLIATGTQGNLNATEINNILVRIPSEKEQRKNAFFLSKIDQIINDQSDKIDELKHQKKAYLQKMFV
ncbi:Type I restriction-modification system specificity subunit [Apilactobacillus kunkeei]|uniref:Type I restriction-modification system specificity subunit n=1 Tax=Apilactobacillus kunkeei TaxID=148814 RepID=A0A0N0CSY9_9LACO|nr:restriction endonuclease subunit S [Apilactobacillus kunkeei]KOY76819.1 Type I restriction-modification system specificity subunit [Apilactobacillus kunkeei]